MNNLTPDDIAAAQTQTHNAFQQLTYLLESKGTITLQELAHIYGEEPEGAPSFRAAAQDVRADQDSKGSHVAHTGSQTRVNKGKQSRAVDSVTSARDSAVVRKPMSKAAAAGAYKRALEALESKHSWHFWGIQEFVRCLRAEAKAWRHQARNAQREVELLKIELEEARRGAHE